jgi:hypothetical protein
MITIGWYVIWHKTLRGVKRVMVREKEAPTDQAHPKWSVGAKGKGISIR